MNLPRARTSELLEREAADRLLIYDLRIGQAYHLSAPLKIIYRSCTGRISFEELHRRFGYARDFVHLALRELSAADLLDDYRPDYFAGLSRKEVIRRIARSALTALPMLIRLTTPLAESQAIGACSASVHCSRLSDCPAPCTTCTGSGTCGFTATACTNIGAPCTSRGTCVGADPARSTLGRCRNYSVERCLHDSDCDVTDTCRGAGHCGT